MNISRYLINWKESIIDALKKMDSIHQGIVLVINENHQLVGVITDSDIRRAILVGTDLSNTVDTIMSKDPVVIHDESDSEIVKIQYSLDQVLFLFVRDYTHKDRNYLLRLDFEPLFYTSFFVIFDKPKKQ